MVGDLYVVTFAFSCNTIQFYAWFLHYHLSIPFQDTI